MLATAEQIQASPKTSDYFIGIDSDGCVFDSMRAKQIQCFHGSFIKHFKLEAVEAQVREVLEFVNLKSIYRGVNRFNSLLNTAELMSKHKALLESGVTLPDFKELKIMAEAGAILSTENIEANAQIISSEELATIAAWSHEVDHKVRTELGQIPHFSESEKSLQQLSETADLMVVSATSAITLENEWANADLKQYVSHIMGLELGKKTKHLQLATDGKYEKDCILMIGDAPGDMHTAEESGCLFFPIHPDDENNSWIRLREEAYPKFKAKTYAGEYQQLLLKNFLALLPSVPPWEQI